MSSVVNAFQTSINDPTSATTVTPTTPLPVTSSPSSGSLGQKNSAGSQSVVLATDQSPVPTNSIGLNNIATSQVSVANTSTLIAAARANRGSIKITNLGAVDVFIGNTGVTTTTGDILLGTKGSSIVIPASVAVYGIVASGTVTVSVMEVY